MELLIKLGNFDFIAEGLRSKAATDNPYYDDWPRDSQYNTKSETVLKIRIVDLLTGEEIFSELTLSNPPPNEISWTSYGGNDFKTLTANIFTMILIGAGTPL
ncbi:MAG: hypothetical protein E7249_17225 [Paenibacillaceae bacterium]|nr:hypothetical protein [Paenibacillaceae bacterium]